jgi:uncharacterized membrane protein (UPF0127 family)
MADDHRGALTVSRKDFRRGVLTLRREDGRIVCETVQVADTILRRMRGLLGRSGLGQGEGLLLRPAWSIHTSFMRFPIDVVFIDHDLVVIRIAASLRPFKVASCRGAREVVELAAGECERRGLEVGDRIAWASRSATDDPIGTPEGLLQPDPKAKIVVASSDQRFVKLTRFLLDGRGFGVSADVRPERIDDVLEDDTVEAILLDADGGLGDALRLSNRIRASRPTMPVVIVGAEAAERAPQAVRVYDKWDQMDEAIDALAAGIAQNG